MDIGTIVALFGGLALFFLISRYLGRRFSGRQDEPDPSPSIAPYRTAKSSHDTTGLVASTSETSTAVIVCQSCGTENSREYRFCRNCVTELSLEEIRNPYG